MPEIHGNIEGLRRTLLTELEKLYTWEVGRDTFVPPEMVDILKEISLHINREIAVYITRDGEVVDVIVGGLDNVSLSEFRLRRNARRLSMVRCIHTHPGGSAELSDVDISALRTMRFDAMAAIGLMSSRAPEIGVGFLGEMEGEQPALRLLGPMPASKIPQEAWMNEIQVSDELVMQGQDQQALGGPERAILIGTESEESLEELKRLAETAGAQVIGTALQKRTRPDGATFIGHGKAEELSLDCQAQHIDVAIFDDELTGIQVRNLEELLHVKVIDRTMLILDIFAQRASTREGKLQVELAQLNYRSTRLIGQGLVLSRLAGGIGTRGPGESKLEISRRRIRERITDVRRELVEMEKQRGIRRRVRERNQVPVVALVGYTNAGKSTLLNKISGADVYVKDQLFATLDAVSRNVKLDSGTEFLLVDTVGFIRKLPHDLVEAFHSTLEEATLADILLIVSDAASPDCLKQHQVVLEVLDQLGASQQPRIDVLNKCDSAENIPFLPGAVQVSATEGTGLDELLKQIASLLNAKRQQAVLLVPFSQYGAVNDVRSLGQIMSEEHLEEGTKITALLEESAKNRLIAKYGNQIFVKKQ
jgi:GTP-binding protein HflX